MWGRFCRNAEAQPLGRAYRTCAVRPLLTRGLLHCSRASTLPLSRNRRSLETFFRTISCHRTDPNSLFLGHPSPAFAAARQSPRWRFDLRVPPDTAGRVLPHFLKHPPDLKPRHQLLAIAERRQEQQDQDNRENDQSFSHLIGGVCKSIASSSGMA